MHIQRNLQKAKNVKIYKKQKCIWCVWCVWCIWCVHRCIRWKIWMSGKHGWGKKKCHKSIEGKFMMKTFLLFFVLIHFKLSAKHFSVLPCYLMKWKDSFRKHWILKLTLNFRGDPSDTASTFLKMASDFDAVITITDCQIW